MTGYVHPLAVVGDPPEHREHRFTGIYHPPSVAPSAVLEAFVTVDAGIGDNTRVGERTWLMKHVHVGHDAKIGDDCELAPGTIIGGHCILGDRVRCGIGVLVRPFITVGADARLGAGAVVVKDVPAGEVWAGNPARRLVSKPVSDEMTDAERSGWDEWYERAHRVTVSR